MKRLNRYQVTALILLLMITVFMMWIGKRHVLIVENVAYKVGGATLKPLNTVIVKISGGNELEIYEGDSDYLEPIGPFCTLEIEITGEHSESSRFFRKRMYLGFADLVKINIPQLAYEDKDGLGKNQGVGMQ